MSNCTFSIPIFPYRIISYPKYDYDLQNLETNLTCDQLISYGIRLTEWSNLGEVVIRVAHVLKATSGLVGIVGYVLMCILCRPPAFNGISFIYHRAFAVLELLHMIFLLQNGIVEYATCDVPPYYSLVFYRTMAIMSGVFNTSLKLSVTLITTFVSVERCAAIWFPGLFAKINLAGVAYTVVGICCVVGFMPSIAMANQWVVSRNNMTGLYIAVDTNFARLGYGTLLASVLYGIKVACISIIAVFGGVIVVGLLVKSRKLAAMTSTRKAREAWADTRRLCIMQIATASSCVVSEIFWIISDAINSSKNTTLGLDAVVQLTYDRAVADIDKHTRYIYLWVTQSLVTQLDHCWRFYLYLLCIAKFRNNFILLFKRFTPAVESVSRISPNCAASKPAQQEQDLEPPVLSRGR